MNITHTPGPWIAQKDIRHSANTGSLPSGPLWWAVYGRSRILKMEEPAPWLSEGEQEANARLVAAAPDLLAALQNARNVLAALATGQLKSIDRDSSALGQARAAIAKAEGRA